MLSCRQLVEKVTQEPELLEQGARPDWSMRLHLFICHHCRRYVRQLRLMLRFLSFLPGREPAQATEVDEVWNAIEQRNKDS